MFGRLARTLCTAYLIAVIVAIAAYKITGVGSVLTDPFFTIYGLVVATYILSRFFLSLRYAPVADLGIEPRIAVVVPAFNEAAAIGSSLRSILAVDYPEGKLEIVVINDGSADETLDEIKKVASRSGRITVIDFAQNLGKRAAMAAGIRATQAEVVVFVDSDSELAPDALRNLVQPFANHRVGAVAGHAEVTNAGENWVARMQAVRYFVAFRVVKAAESIFGAVTCTSGCLAAYRRSAIIPHLSAWEKQSFLGKSATFGDDRSLTNYVLRSWDAVYQSNAVTRTIVPATIQQFLRQQLRWKRSWTRESLIISRFIWRTNPAAAVGVYVGIALNLLAPIVAVRALAVRPLAGFGTPILYLVGLYAMALVYALYYAARKGTRDGVWVYGIVFVYFYLVFLLWQTYYALLTCRKNHWGTRAASHGTDRGPFDDSERPLIEITRFPLPAAAKGVS